LKAARSGTYIGMLRKISVTATESAVHTVSATQMRRRYAGV